MHSEFYIISTDWCLIGGTQTLLRSIIKLLKGVKKYSTGRFNAVAA